MSLFDQFQESVESLQSVVAQEPAVTGGQATILERDLTGRPHAAAMFALDQVQYQFPQIRDIVVSCVFLNVLVIGALTHVLAETLSLWPRFMTRQRALPWSPRNHPF